mmetsp:Transcript_19558/g.39641  ORF Transcript_19558/g.39641 Transcript_19558/m.39641 type:complete len:304 (+) Transcript_19558:71-982(+)|eukprot:CAMPEP_0167787462 /NCGR_PEP_ID=MMETSP0111_2-20121227/9438_1 /TAXON_ID=91324 /ORGANISM="Lotharella globosa, Strain CCCM811" /LENGTH=303 /DNA_ID=CAMNT_0007679111 /DNA_START=71 /DNA_END=982 /DNA_ORIENTATION=+
MSMFSKIGTAMKNTGNLIKAQATGTSEPDQKKRFETYKGTGNDRYLSIEKLFKGVELKGKSALVIGAGCGVGPAIVRELSSNNAMVIATIAEKKTIEFPPGVKVLQGIGTSGAPPAEAGGSSDMQTLTKALEGKTVDILILNEPPMKPSPSAITSGVDPEKAHRDLDVYALAPINVVSALVSSGSLKRGSKVVNINHSDSSIAWRKSQGKAPFDYSYHMARCASNMAMQLLHLELKEKGILFVTMHPGFNKTEMTKELEEHYEAEGAVEPEIGAKRILHEANKLNTKKAGKYINAEDGLSVPW